MLQRVTQYSRQLFRPAVDALVLALLARTTFAYGHVVQGRSGECRLHPQLARAMAAGCRVEQERVRDGTQQLREMLVASNISQRPTSTPSGRGRDHLTTG
jgi:hypothetical protein